MLLNNIKIELLSKEEASEEDIVQFDILQKKFDSLTTVELETMIKYSLPKLKEKFTKLLVVNQD
jgi:hypothetical protein